MNQMGSNMLNGVALPVFTKDLSPEEKKGAQAYSAHLASYFKREGQKSLDEADKWLQSHDWFSGGDKPGIGDVSWRDNLPDTGPGDGAGECRLSWDVGQLSDARGIPPSASCVTPPSLHRHLPASQEGHPLLVSSGGWL